MSHKNVKNAFQYGAMRLNAIIGPRRPVGPTRGSDAGFASTAMDKLLGISDVALMTLRDASCVIPVPAVGIAATLALGLLQHYTVSITSHGYLGGFT